MRTKTLTTAVAAIGFTLMSSSAAFALTAVGEPFAPEGAPPAARLWQEYEAEQGDIHWTFALRFATERGMIGPNATTSEEVQAAENIMRMVLESELNDEARWGRDVSGGKVYPTFRAGERYFLPVLPAVAATAVAPAVQTDMEAYFAELREQVDQRVEEFNQSLVALDLETLRGDVVAAAVVATQLEDLQTSTAGLTSESAGDLAAAKSFVELLQEGRLDEAAGLQAAIKSMIDEAVAGETAAREAADTAITEEGGVIDTRVGNAIGDLEARLFDAQGNLIVPAVEVLGILEQEGLVEDGKLVVDLTDNPALAQVRQLFDEQGNPLFVDRTEFEELKQNLGPFASFTWQIWLPMVLGVIGLLVALVAWLTQRGLRTQVRKNTDDIDELQQLNLAGLEWHEGNSPKGDLRALTPGEENAVTWRVRRVGTTDWCSVKLSREAGTPSDYVLADLKRKAGDDEPIGTPFSLEGNRLKLSILKAIKRGALVPDANPPVFRHSSEAA